MGVRTNRRIWIGGLWAWTVLGAVGCSATGQGSMSLLGFAQAAKTAASAAASAETCVVEFRSEGEKPRTEPMPLEGQMFVQDVLNKSGAFKRFRRVSVELVRVTPKGNPHKMAITVDSGKRLVEPQCNYHVRPGDRLLVTEDTSTVIGDMLENLGGPFSKKKPASSSIRG